MDLLLRMWSKKRVDLCEIRVETYYIQQFSDPSRNGIYLSLAGIVLHMIGGVSVART